MGSNNPLANIIREVGKKRGVKTSIGDFSKLPLTEKISIIKTVIPQYVAQLTEGYKQLAEELSIQQLAKQTIAALATLPTMTTAQLKELSQEELYDLRSAVIKGNIDLSELYIAIKDTQP